MTGPLLYPSCHDAERSEPVVMGSFFHCTEYPSIFQAPTFFVEAKDISYANESDGYRNGVFAVPAHDGQRKQSTGPVVMILFREKRVGVGDKFLAFSKLFSFCHLLLSPQARAGHGALP